MHKRLFIVAGIGIVAIGGYVSLARTTKNTPAPRTKPSVTTITVSPTAFRDQANFSGFVRGINQSDIAPKTSGYVVRMTKEEGDTVSRGEVLAVLDGRELSAAAKSSLLSLRSIGETILKTKHYYDQKVREAETTFDHAADADRDTAKEAVRSAKRLRDSQLTSLETEQAGLEGSVLVSETNAADATIRAPFSGTITKKYFSIGSFASVGTPLYSIASGDATEIILSLPASVATNLHPHAMASVSDGASTKPGYIFSLVSVADESTQRSTARIRFATSGPEGSFHLGTYVRVSFNLDTDKMALVVPETALLSAYDDTFVYVVENGIAKKQHIVPGTDSDQGREILSGLYDGAQVVIEGEYALSDNQPVDERHVTR